MGGEANQVLWRGTRKVHPAIGDLQAIEDSYEDRSVTTQAGAGNYTELLIAIPSGKMVVAQSITMYCSAACTSICHLYVSRGGNGYTLARRPSLAAQQTIDFHTPLLLDEGDIVAAVFQGVPGADITNLFLLGYQVDKY